MKTVFFDTEFTRFRDARHEPKLISIGCVTQDGQEFYAELTDTWQPSDCSGFVIETVLPLLDGGSARMMEAQLAVRLKEWVEGLTDNKMVVFRSDGPAYDWPLVEYLFDFYGWPHNLRRKYGYIHFDHLPLETRYNRALEDYWREHGSKRHHALVDARSLQHAWKQAIKRGI